MSGPTSEERDFWEENGYLEFEQAIEGEDLRRLQAAFDRAARECKDEWLEGDRQRNEACGPFRHS